MLKIANLKTCYFCLLKIQNTRETNSVWGMICFPNRIGYKAPAEFSNSVFLSRLQVKVLFKETNANWLKEWKSYWLFDFGLEILDFWFNLCVCFLRSLLIWMYHLRVHTNICMYDTKDTRYCKAPVIMEDLCRLCWVVFISFQTVG